VQEIDKNVPDKEDEKKIQELPEYMKLCAELTLSSTVNESEIGAKVFHLITGTAVFGVCLAELKDSFFVAMPCQLVSDAGKVEGKPFTKAKVIRLIRSSIAFVSIPESDHKYYYYRWLRKQFNSLPSFFSEARRDIVEQVVYNYENRDANRAKQNEDQLEDIPEVEDDSAEGSPDSFWSPYQSTEFH